MQAKFMNWNYDVWGGGQLQFLQGKGVLNIEEKRAAGILWKTNALATDGQKNHRNDTKKR